MKKHKLAKEALNHPDLFTQGELAYFNMWLRSRKERKAQEKQKKKEDLERVYKM